MAQWITSFVIVLCFIKPAENCESFKIPKGDVLGCVLEDRQVLFDKSKNATIPTGTVCIVNTNLGIINARCTGSDLEVTKDLEDSKKPVRRKRFVVFAFFLILIFALRAGPRDITPPRLVCEPPIIYKTADRYKRYAIATWKVPKVYDDSDGITLQRKSRRRSGSHFPEYDTRITYVAKDSSGNRASCTITVRVKVVRCSVPKKITNGYVQCSPVTEFLYGCTCKFGCYEGFDLDGGPDEIRCEKTGQWSAPQPICKPWVCPDLPPLDGAGNPECTNGFKFRSICSYNCGSGFDMPPKVSKALVCDKDKYWRNNGKPKCIDVEPPTFTKCPISKIFGTDVGLNSTIVTWEPPKVDDNSKKAKTYLIRGEPPGTRLPAGPYKVKYGAEDDAGNQAIHDCSFYVIVREIRCPKLYPTPFVLINCPGGYRSGSSCNISCDPGKILNGSNYVVCNKSPDGLFGCWNWEGGQQTLCKNGKQCVTMTPPKNGAVACDNWEGGEYCQIKCKGGTEMSSVRLKTLYVCSSDGGWSPPLPNIRTCLAVRQRKKRDTFALAALYYYYGDCNNPETQLQIANNLITAMNGSVFQPEACADVSDCNAKNVQVDCGKSDRKKRSTSNESKPRNILELTMHFPMTSTSYENMYMEARYESLVTNMKSILIANVDNIFGNGTVDLKQMQSKGLQIHCPEGAVKSEQTWNCIDCPEGTFYTKTSNHAECVACRKGNYQDKVAQMKCIRCPVGTTTQTVGAKFMNECQDACQPGSYSQDGLLPCSPCEQGEYQPSYGQTFCRTCMGTTSTLTFGSASASECEEFDIDVIQEDHSDIQVTLAKSVNVKDFTLAFWYRSATTGISNTSLSVKFSNEEEHVIWSWNNLTKVKRQNMMERDVNLEMPDSRWHHVTLYSGSACDIVMTMDGMPLHVPIMTHAGSCTNMVLKKLSILAGKGSDGSISKFSMWRGKRNTDYQQRCFSSNVGDIVSWKKFEEANITGAFMHFPSQCDDFDNCVSSPCLHGSCSDALHGFRCSCDKGYIGTQCDVNIDDCDVNICINNATCVDGAATYTCLCPDEYTGQYCEIKMVDGGWSEWGNWSECTTTCGNGEMTRMRLCNSPTPDNGGEDCAGETFDYKDCNNSDCPVCPRIFPPLNGSLDCFNDTEAINCTVSCDEGFDFDIEPLPLYYCGPETFQEWNYQTVKNPERRLPTCVDDTTEAMNDLQAAFQYIQNASDSGELTITIRDDEFEIDSNLTDISGKVDCRPGETSVRIYCVPCGQGSFLYTDYCKPCPVGTYQHLVGQSDCIKCPAGKSTTGILSTNIGDCTVDELIGEDGFQGIPDGGFIGILYCI